MQNGKVMAIVGVLVLIAMCVGAIFLFAPRKEAGAQPAAAAPGGDVAADVEPTIPETRQVAEGWREYANSAFHFKFRYPEGLQAREYKEAGGAMSVVFENPQTGEGFQLYVTPYAETQITKERFRLDLPSGVMKEPTDVIIGGVRGTMFWSTNSIMGETREVWFINGGFLYEVVTYKRLDTWLASIMQTWEFI